MAGRHTRSRLPAAAAPGCRRRARGCLASVALLAGLALAGCTENSTVLTAFRAVRTTVGGAPDLEVSREQVSKLPYASMLARVGRGVQALLLLSEARGDEQHWRAGDEAVLVLRYGRLVRTAGFNANLVGSRTLQPDPVEYGLHRLTAPRQFTRTLDIQPGDLFEQPVDCRVEVVGARRITIVEIEFDTVLAREDCEARLVRWAFTNYYWVDPVDGFVWRATQHFVRSQPALEYSVLKPPG